MMVNVIGLGYIGLPTALMLASRGVLVVGTDYDKKLLDKLKNGVLTFEEKGLSDLYLQAIEKGVKFSDQYQKTDMYIIAVPTPYDSVSKKINPEFVISAIQSVLDVCEKGSIIIIESTISPGTVDKIIKPLVISRNLVVGEDVHLVHAPERIIPGNMIFELKNNSRTIGTDLAAIGLKVKEMYAAFCKGEIIITDIRSAEMTKVIENTYRDVNIAFANEIAKICRSESMDVYEIIRIANKHPRVNILQPGPGVGGHCISVDPWFLVGDYPNLTKIISTARNVNDSMPEFVIQRLHEIMVENNVDELSQVGIYGLTYKENVDDTRESPTLQLLNNLNRHLARGIKVFDPFVKESIVVNQVQNFDEFLSGIKVIVVMVSHAHIIENQSKLKGKIILDTKNVFCETEVYKL